MEIPLSLFHLFQLLQLSTLFHLVVPPVLFHISKKKTIAWHDFFNYRVGQASPRQCLMSFVDPDSSISQPLLPTLNTTLVFTNRQIVSPWHTVFPSSVNPLLWLGIGKFHTKRLQTIMTIHPNTRVCFVYSSVFFIRNSRNSIRTPFFVDKESPCRHRAKCWLRVWHRQSACTMWYKQSAFSMWYRHMLQARCLYKTCSNFQWNRERPKETCPLFQEQVIYPR